MLIATLELDKRFKFDISKRAVEIQPTVFKSLMKELDEGRSRFGEYDLWVDLREHILPPKLPSLISDLASLNRIVGVHLFRIIMVDYSYSQVARLVDVPRQRLFTTFLEWESAQAYQVYWKPAPPQIHITVALAIAGHWSGSTPVRAELESLGLNFTRNVAPG